MKYSPIGVLGLRSSGKDDSFFPLAMGGAVLGAGMVGGKPVGTFSVISPSNPGSRVAVMMTFALPPGTPSGGSILIARLKGAFSLTASATNVGRCIGG